MPLIHQAQMPEDKEKKKKQPTHGSGGYLDSLMLPPGQPLNQPMFTPGGGRVAVKQPSRPTAPSTEPLSPTWSQSQPDSDRAQSVRRPSANTDGKSKGRGCLTERLVSC